MTRPFPKVNPHGELRELFDNIFFATGGVKMAGPISFSRNMTLIRDGESLTLVGSMRLNDDGLVALDKLGKVEHVIRLAGFHGMDDPFYKDRYGAKIWTVEEKYAAGFNATKENPETYFEPDSRSIFAATSTLRESALELSCASVATARPSSSRLQPIASTARPIATLAAAAVIA